MSASANVILRDFLDNDSYPLQGAYVNKRLPNTGSFFRRLIARNFIHNRPARIKRGYIPNGRMMSEDDFQTEHYVIRDISDPDMNGVVRLQLIDQLFFASNGKAKIPIVANAVTLTEIPETSSGPNPFFTFLATSFGNKGIANSDIVVGDTLVVNIGNELFRGTVNSYDPNTNQGDFIYSERGVGGSEQSAHSIGTDIQGCVEFNSQNVTDIMRTALRSFTRINSSLINDATWDTLKASDLSQFNLTTFLTEPIAVNEMLKQIIVSTGMWMYFDVILNSVEIGIVPRFSDPVLSVDRNTLIKNTIISKPAIDRQVTRSIIRYGKIDYTEGNDLRNYNKHFRRQNDILEDDSAFGQITEDEEIRSNWYTSRNEDVVLAQSVPALKVERFARIPRTHVFQLDSAHVGNLANGRRLWYGSTISIESTSRVNLDDSPVIETAQVIAIKRSNELDTWRITALSYDSASLPVPPSEVDLTITQNTNNVNLSNLIADRSTAKQYVVIVSAGVLIGAGASTFAMTTGTGFPVGSTFLIYNMGQIVGRGGDGGIGGFTSIQDLIFRDATDPTNGTDALVLNYDTSIDNLQGLIGGGGGGGVAADASEDRSSVGGSGGGGAGLNAGLGGISPPDSNTQAAAGQNGTLSFGGNPGISFSVAIDNASKGGDLGEDTAGALAGSAIVRNGNNVVILNGNNSNQIKGRIV